MSTKAMLVVVPDPDVQGEWHLYEEMFDEDFVWLDTPDGERLAIPNAVWNQLRQIERPRPAPEVADA